MNGRRVQFAHFPQPRSAGSTVAFSFLPPSPTLS
jgi:hypothetical protein